ncbi:hypothetical protein K469DRAFT_617486 [Zopfia rhizophila CBS 207.26]|uniref:Sin3-associated polypeptide Sap18 n=1 Tax=Zopfia rhizophila CBS 207.26 TaxID=1314779 RepID=A0A6A6EY20_9PEZI|nr:hypothetical protein K469DRAFT_617486 [Zopfia rhizophila CBS 207.26]
MASQAPTPKVDRQTTTPFLLRLFYKNGAFHRLDEFSPSARLPPHLEIYTWQTCTLRELTHLLLTALPNLLPSPAIGTRVAFRLIFADTRQPPRDGAPGRYIWKELGSVVVSASPGQDGEDEDTEDAGRGAGGVKEALKNLDGEPDKTLANGRFVIGDYISCAILPPLPDGSTPAVPPPPSNPLPRGPPPNAYGGGRGGPSQNGYGGRGDYGYGGGRGRGGSRFDDRFDDRRGGSGSGFPSGEWRRGEAPPGGYWRGRGRGRGVW